MATITRYKQDIIAQGSLANGLGGGAAVSPVGPGGATGYVYASVTKIVAASTDPNPFVYNVDKAMRSSRSMLPARTCRSCSRMRCSRKAAI